MDAQDRENLLIESPDVTMARTRYLLARSRATLDAASRRLAIADDDRSSNGLSGRAARDRSGQPEA